MQADRRETSSSARTRAFWPLAKAASLCMASTRDPRFKDDTDWMFEGRGIAASRL